MNTDKHGSEKRIARCVEAVWEEPDVRVRIEVEGPAKFVANTVREYRDGFRRTLYFAVPKGFRKPDHVRTFDLPESPKLIYLASPYSHPDPAVREQRFNAVCWAAARLMREGHLIFSPIAHTHPIAQAGGLPGDWEFWRRYDHAMLDAAAEVWVLKLSGWDESRGVAEEIKYANDAGKPVRYVDPQSSEGKQ